MEIMAMINTNYDKFILLKLTDAKAKEDKILEI